MTETKNKSLTVLSDAEQFALYGLPDFDEEQRSEFLSLSPQELLLASSRSSLHAQAHCALQIGYFKAKHAFFHFTWSDVREDCDFILSRYFNAQAFEMQAVTKHERYAQCAMIAELFTYRLWSSDILPCLVQRADQIGVSSRNGNFCTVSRFESRGVIHSLHQVPGSHCLPGLTIFKCCPLQVGVPWNPAVHSGLSDTVFVRES